MECCGKKECRALGADARKKIEKGDFRLAHTPVIPGPGRPREEDFKFQTSLDNVLTLSQSKN